MFILELMRSLLLQKLPYIDIHSPHHIRIIPALSLLSTRNLPPFAQVNNITLKGLDLD